MHLDPLHLLLMAPPMLLAMWAQGRVRTTYSQASHVPSQLSGAAAARYVLDSAGLDNVQIEQVEGQLSDHYDPRHKVLRLSHDVYYGRNAAAVGIAAHEAGHAIQDATRYAPLVVRNLAVPVANLGSGAGIVMFVLGASMGISGLAWAGFGLFSAVVFFQLVNLPVEFDASARAKKHLATLGIVGPDELPYVGKVLNSAAWTYVAGTLQSAMMLVYLFLRSPRRAAESDPYQ